METQQLIKLMAAIAAACCIGFGIFALFRGLKAEGSIKISSLLKGEIKTGSAGLFLLFFGLVLFSTIIIKGETKRFHVTEETSSQPVSQPVAATPTHVQAVAQDSSETRTYLPNDKVSIDWEKAMPKKKKVEAINEDNMYVPLKN